ncbi:MAG: hypothetical protein LQ345_004689 [Seirophora villosa]|nr:MAG: hypothetical protein LQ345_004689 [Seirophora villosa]
MASTSSLDVLIVTFNCGRNPVRPELLARHLADAFPDSQSPDIIMLSLQEIAPIAYSFLGGSYLLPYLGGFRHAIHLAGKSFGGARYTTIATRNVGMTACMVFVHEEQKDKIQRVETGAVGVGVQEMGNKGAVGVRLGYSVPEGITELTFVAAHLAPMEDGLARRNEDWMNIVRGLVFPTVHSKAVHDRAEHPTASAESEPLLLPNDAAATPERASGIYTPTSHLILAGDLNYRTSSTIPRPADHLAFPQPTTSPADPHHYSHLLRHDQLTREREAGRTCHALREAPIDFPPTYKYSGKAQARAGTTTATGGAGAEEIEEWAWAKHRWPSWCDRILFLDLPARTTMSRNAEIGVQRYTALPLMPTSDHRPVVLRLQVPLIATPAPEDEGDEGVRTRPPFPVDPRWRERRAAARRKEVVVGMLAYLFWTWEGMGILLALLVGALGGWAVVRRVMLEN